MSDLDTNQQPYPNADDQLDPDANDQSGFDEDQEIANFKAHLNHLKRIRLLAFRRLAVHNRLATWTVALVSVALIIGAIWRPLQLPVRVEAPFVDVTQVFFAFLVLVYSLLLSLENFGLLSERMYVAYEDLNRLDEEMSEYKARHGAIDRSAFADFINQEITILKDKPVPSNIDARRHELAVFVGKKAEDPDAKWHGFNYTIDHIRTVTLYYSEFAHYVIVILLVLAGTFVPLCFPIICAPLQEPYIPG